MSDREPLAAFDDDGIRAVAADRGDDEAAVRDLVRRHQESVRDLPGVEDIVYEWRRMLPRPPLIERREDAYYLLLRRDVWEEYRDALSLTEGEFAALRAVHARQFAAAVGAAGSDGDDGREAAADDDREPMVLTRP